MQAKISDYLTKKLPEKQVQVSAPLLMRYPVKGGMRQLVADDIEGKQVMSVKTTLREFCRSFPDTYLLAPPHVPAPSVTPAYCKRLLNSVEDGIPFIGAFEVFEIRDMRDRNNTSTKHYIIDGKGFRVLEALHD
ncbi:hypothetical protein SARC_11136 [Sphaeroforma arctica JP610]|uniref:Uncharacterized protein n=1 Tax=Sphaeroforma arctica JP610 TaxID=667725 RepID=A0A0L0FJY3_9EUKA|nr:hypothetical protein SARC_11136 [Sphaeroforma arctica JP610]KNC76358.1 hypothetical protein SARC_11136 [Sphaeroforma arctica JP610]|eukprot:XP_014150260.1 hypothetical protein SARC_11136 [Sphaeroforma arctica JP610]